MNLVWLDSAREHLRSIVGYIAERNAPAARDLNERIAAVAERLVDHPHMFRPGRVSGTREALVHPNYLIVYQVTNEAVVIVSILHSRQLYPPAD